jgi:Glycosyl hydrolase family 63 C-terminal domain/Mannosylglycerate hydrolase MGH1-like glycoside hydrolase domain
MMAEASEHDRLSKDGINWKRWGPYLSERQWGTVREDYSQDGNAWDYFSHDQARSRAYRWGEDGLGGISDRHQVLCFALGLWNGKDPIIKERLFGLTNSEGNHGEDVKEYYFYLDSTPTHSYMKYLYKYPQAAYPYANLVNTNRGRTRNEAEYELLDTGVFDQDRYFDVFVEYAKESPDDMLIQISVCNRGKEVASLHVLPTLWFRNTWSWPKGGSKPELKSVKGSKCSVIRAHHSDPLFQESLADYYLYCEGTVPLLFTENDTNTQRIFGVPNRSPYVKDSINEYIVHGQKDAVNPGGVGTKASPHYQLTVGPGATQVVRLRLTRTEPGKLRDPFGKFEAIVTERIKEADEFYDALTPPAFKGDRDRANLIRQALAGMLWTKQYYYFDADQWLEEHHAHPLHREDKQVTRNREWFHMVNDDIISMPDKWEYPWYAAWDLAFHTIALAAVDPDFARQQLDLMLSQHYLHPNGQIPAYEWNFSDVNPPVHAFATLFLTSRRLTHDEEIDWNFLKSAFSKLLLNFTWWINRKDRFGKNVFEGGFLGLDNIGVFDRSAPLPTGGHLEQADGTSWMAFFSQNMAELAVILASHDPIYDEMAAKFVEHFVWIAAAMNQPGTDGMWDEEDGFYYDILRTPDGKATRLKVRSMVGLLPLCATTVVEPWQRERIPKTMASLQDRFRKMPELLKTIHATGKGHFGVGDRGIIALVNEERLRRILTRMLDENEFLSPYGIRSLSKFHEKHPYVFQVGGQEYRVNYLPGESDSGMFGGNSNWRGPIWMPVNTLIVRALINYYLYYGDNFKIECPTGSGRMMNLFEVAQEITERLARIFLRDNKEHRPVYGGTKKFQDDPHWRDHLLFYEYFHGDNGAGLGASHQTGWTGLVGALMRLLGTAEQKQFLEAGKREVLKGLSRGSQAKKVKK